MNTEGKYIAYCDGGCRPTNPGKGGYGVVLFNPAGELIEWYYDELDWTTNNIMELKGIYKALEMYDKLNTTIPAEIYTDSAYALNCVTNWAHSWVKNNWYTSKGAPVQNRELIETIYNYYNANFLNCKVEILKTKGHTGIIGNELVDRLAAADLENFRKIIVQNKLVVNCSLEKLDNSIKDSND